MRVMMPPARLFDHASGDGDTDERQQYNPEQPVHCGS
jgi:hypothetical protein